MNYKQYKKANELHRIIWGNIAGIRCTNENVSLDLPSLLNEIEEALTANFCFGPHKITLTYK